MGKKKKSICYFASKYSGTFCFAQPCPANSGFPEGNPSCIYSLESLRLCLQSRVPRGCKPWRPSCPSLCPGQWHWEDLPVFAGGLGWVGEMGQGPGTVS